MVRINNYTTNQELEIECQYELEEYLSVVSEDDEVSYEVDRVGLLDSKNCLEWLELDSEEQSDLEAISEHNGIGYHKTIEDLKSAYEDSIWYKVEGVDSNYSLASWIEQNDEELLYNLLGCTAKAYEQLGRYVSTDDLASTLDIECDVTYVGGNAYLWF